jgi:hypothetical protein
MKYKILKLSFVIVFVFNIIDAKSLDFWQKIQKITPLVSTKLDIESIFGKPDKIGNNEFIEYYTIKSGRLFVEYSNGICSQNKQINCLPKNTVESFSFNIKKEIEIETFFRQIKLDLKIFDLSEYSDGDTPDLFYKYQLNNQSFVITAIRYDGKGKKYLRDIEVESWEAVCKLLKNK